MNQEIADVIEKAIKDRVQNTLIHRTVPELTSDVVATDSIGEVIDKLCILHIRTWFLEDIIDESTSDAEVASIKRKVDICFKKKRPQYIQAINKMIDDAIQNGTALAEDSVKIYKAK
jgi:hypothetical protein